MIQRPAIAITGMGWNSPFGAEAAPTRERLRANTTALVELEFGALGTLRHAPVELPRDAARDWPLWDPTVPLACDVARRALDSMAGGSPLAGARVAVVVGSSKGLLRHPIALLSGRPIPPGLIPPGVAGDLVGGEIARQLGLAEAIVVNVPAACATGLTTLAHAAQMLEDDLVDVALAGAAEMTDVPVALAAFLQMGALTRDACRPFDARRSGFNTGSGAAVFVLQRAADAAAARVRPIAMLSGYDVRSGAWHPTALDPDGLALEVSLRSTLRRAQWAAGDVEVINAHATGTPLNDLAEARALHRVFAASAPPVYGWKGALGHLLGASAAVELALSIDCCATGYQPCTVGLEQIDGELPWLNHPRAPQAGVWARRLVKNALGFGGPLATVAVDVAQAGE